MSTSPTQLPPLVTPIVDPETGLATVAQQMWDQLLLLSRSTWISYTPTTTHLTAITQNECFSVQAGKLIVVRIGLTGTTDGTALTVTLPFLAKSRAQALMAIENGAVSGFGLIGTDLVTVTVTKYDGTTLANGNVVQWFISGAYEAQ